ncbi:PDZ domain protein [Rhynchospora pubera]|uniref:PDZ domain protein n=1 Tax=Rhynchospora pubera TaxID=906938 RepID=A0AAV8GN38_9POAL|nr:PDZ domain protein [Rhynchospora pubera]
MEGSMKLDQRSWGDSVLGKRKKDSMSRGSVSFKGNFDEAISFVVDRKYPDIKNERAALKMSPSVVSVFCSIGGMESFGSGTIIESIHAEGEFTATVLTSSYVVHSRDESNNTLEIRVRLANGEDVLGTLTRVDPYYRIALVEIHSKVQLRVAELRPVDDSLDFSQDDTPSLYLGHEYKKIHPGERCTIVGRISQKWPFEAVAFTVEYPQRIIFNWPNKCDELVLLSGRMLYHCTGGPVINSDSEVIGVAQGRGFCPSFIPTNVVLRWLDAIKSGRPLRRLRLQMDLWNLYSEEFGLLEKFAQLRPDVSKGIIVKTNYSLSPLFSQFQPNFQTELLPGDAIVECDGEIVCGRLRVCNFIIILFFL